MKKLPVNISKIESHTKALCAAFMSLQFGFVILWRRLLAQKLLLKCWLKKKLTPG
jgi:hypothetical protein